MTGGEAGDDLAFSVHEELGEVPLDVAAELGVGRLAGQEGVERGLVRGLDGDLAEQVEGGVVFGRAELANLPVRARLLLAEVVGGEGEDAEALGLVLLVQLLQRGVLGCVAAERGGVTIISTLPL